MPIEEVPLLSPCPAAAAPMLSKKFGGKFKYLNRKNSEFLARHSNANAKPPNLKSPKPKIFTRTQNRPNPTFLPEPKILTQI